jgi:hypothetical protein
MFAALLAAFQRDLKVSMRSAARFELGWPSIWPPGDGR